MIVIDMWAKSRFVHVFWCQLAPNHEIWRQKSLAPIPKFGTAKKVGIWHQNPFLVPNVFDDNLALNFKIWRKILKLEAKLTPLKLSFKFRVFLC